jgi:hypothetical protein
MGGGDRPAFVAAGLMLCVVTGCAGLGPTTVNRDRFDYITAISESWKKQTLLNIVKLRYADTPVFLEVGQVISGYEVEGTLSAGGAIGSKTAPGALGDFVNLGASGRYLDRPTVTYAPLTGPDFIKTMMTPFPPSAVMFLIEAGWPVDVVIRAGVQAINGLRNHKGGLLGHPPDPEFVELVKLLRRIQQAGAMGISLQRDKDSQEATMFIFHTRRLTPELATDVAAVKQMLRIKPDVNELRITYGADALGEKELALQTRSGYQVMIELASLVTAPPAHVADHRTIAGDLKPADGKPVLPPLVAIQSGVEEPADAFVRVRYRDHWFWIDDRDFQSKRVLSFLMVLFTLSETGQRLQQPILTIRTN